MESNPYSALTPEGFARFGSKSETSLNPFAAVIVIIGIVLVLILPRKYVMLPLLAICILIPETQVISVAGLNFMTLRVMILVGWYRLLKSKLGSIAQEINYSSIDRTVLLYCVTGAVAFTILWHAGGAVIKSLGALYNALGVYFLLRWCIRDQEDVERATRVLAYICIVVAVFMVYERQTTRNWFSIFGLPEFSEIRDGHVRAQACFAHPILAGTFAATLAPLFLVLRRTSKEIVATLAFIAATAATFASGSSTPAITMAVGVCGYFLWPLRSYMRSVRIGLVTLLVLLQLFMSHPIWFLLAYIGKYGGSSGYHRYQLIDQAVGHFFEWFMFGTQDTSHWGWNMWDISNYYVSIGTNGGLIPLILFIVIIIKCFRSLGTARKSSAQTGKQMWHWALGCTLLAHATAFTGVTYFDQIIVAWYALLAMIVTASRNEVEPCMQTAGSETLQIPEDSYKPVGV